MSVPMAIFTAIRMNYVQFNQNLQQDTLVSAGFFKSLMKPGKYRFLIDL